MTPQPKGTASKNKHEPKVWIRYRARVTRAPTPDETLRDPLNASGVEWKGASHRKQSEAIKEGVDYALKHGIVAIEEVPMKRKLAASYEEVVE
jgi:hypothetical protein